LSTTTNAAGDKKLFTRLGEDGATDPAKTDTDTSDPASAAQQDDKSADGGLGGPRPVRIIPISPGGQGGGNGASGIVVTTTTTGPAKPAGSMTGIAGLQIDAPTTGGRPGGYPQGTTQLTGRAMLPQQTDTGTPQRDIVVAPQKKVAVVTPMTNSATGNTTTGATTPAATKVAVPRATREPAAVSVTTPLSNGYVAVLSSQRSRMDAMKAYASIDQKYRDMLASSTFDVQEADLGDKGVWYRAVVGPPRSFEGAKKICEDLKSAGYPSCWPARY
jgi:hypothetical protein